MNLIKMKTIFVLMIMASYLCGCSFPGAATPSPATAQAIQVATQVALMLTPTIVSSSPTSPMVDNPTATTAPSETAVPPSQTPLPTNTPTSTLTPTLTLTPTVTLTSTLQPTQTPLPGDPKANLGAPTWSTTFTNDKAFGLDSGPADDPEYRFEVKNGAMVMTGKKPDGFHAWRLTIQNISNFYLEGTFQTGDCTGLDRYGLMFRAPDTETGYFFGVSCDGQFNLRNLASSGFSDIEKWTKNSAIQTGSNQTNRLGVMAKDNKLSLYVNGQHLGDFTDSSYTSGVFGYFIASTNTPNLTVQSNSIQYWVIK